MILSKLNILEMSDVHLGHRTTPTYHIIESLNKMFKEKVTLREVDLLIIAGDLFDRLLHAPSSDIALVLDWLHWLVRVCRDNDVMIRVLEGTPSHDNKQPRLVMEVEKIANSGCDIKYVDDLCIEHIDRFGIDVLYIPDEYHPDTTQTLLEVRELISSKGLKQVDFAIMHGAFDYQIPAKLLNRIPHHSSEAYLGLVKYLIFIGHIHQYSMYKRILSAGSTDRLKHGEEEKKGMIHVICYKSGEFDANFIVNENAMIYKTLDVRELTSEQSLALVNEVVSSVPEGSYIRIKAGADNETSNAIKTFKAHHPEFNWTTITQKQDNCKTELLSKPETGMDNLHAKTIPKLVGNRLVSQVSDEVSAKAVELLKEIINEHGSDTAIGKRQQ